MSRHPGGRRHSAPRHSLLRRAATALTAATMLALAGCASGPSVEPTGETTTVEVRMLDMRYEPDVIEVPLGNRLVIELINDDTDIHDLEIDNGAKSSRFGHGRSETLEVGVIDGDMDGWCTVPPHREHGMVLTIKAI